MTDNNDTFCMHCFTEKYNEEFCPCCEAIGITECQTEIPFTEARVVNHIRSRFFHNGIYCRANDVEYPLIHSGYRFAECITIGFYTEGRSTYHPVGEDDEDELL